MLPKLERALALAGLEAGEEHPWSGSPRRALVWAAEAGARAVQLDATAAGIRPRELEPSARRDLAATLRRAGMDCAGLDLFIPPAHFTDPTKVDRAVTAVLQAVELCADLSRLASNRLVLSTQLPADTPEDVLSRLALSAEHHGVSIADHAWPPRAPRAGLGQGIDPAAIFISGGDPIAGLSTLGGPPLAARLSDVSAVGRCLPGSGRLETQAYEPMLFTAGFTGRLVIDLRGLPRQQQAAATLLSP
ncbi:MAG: sugar phosphate isomerase/epimerase family protein [Phycisphaerales bacterium]